MGGGEGSLRVIVGGGSSFLQSHMPYVVRNADLAVVSRGQAGIVTEGLTEGSYAVAALTPAGTELTHIISIAPGETTTLVLDDADVIASSPSEISPIGESYVTNWNREAELLRDRGPRFDPVHLLRSMFGRYRVRRPPPVGPASIAVETNEDEILPPLDVDRPHEAELVAWQGCEPSGDAAAGWTFLPDRSVDEVPTAVILLDGQHWEMSLPLSSVVSDPELGSCRVNVVTEDGTTRARMSFGARRRVSRMVDGLLTNNEVQSGTTVLAEATDLLLAKYADPTGAALGALTLHRLGLLAERKAWLENLARDFSWIPDGQFLLAALLQRDPDERERERGLTLLLNAATDRPLFTDGLSLATELLRRWPGTELADKREDRLDRLSHFSAYADWGATNLCVDVTEGVAWDYKYRR